MSWKTKLVAAAAAAVLCMAHAQAATLELVADVAANVYQAGRIEQGAVVYDSVAGFVPQHFEFTVRIDLDHPYTSEGSLALIPLLRDVTSTFADSPGNWVSESPFSADMMALLPDPAGAVAPARAFAIIEQSTPVVEVPTQPVRILGSVAMGQGWLSTGAPGTATVAYHRGFDFSVLGEVMPSDALHAMTGEQFASFLQSKVGQAGFGRYQESVGLLFAGGEPVISMDALHVFGDVTIKSVAVVPEPSTYLLMGLGLSLVAVARRRQQAA